MSGAMVQHVSGVTGALDDASGQVAQVGACVMRTGQQIQSAVGALFGDMMSAGGNAGAFAGLAATAAANAIAPLRSQMDECAHAAGQASTALSVCSARILSAAERADRAGAGVEALAWIVDSLDLADAMNIDMSAQIPSMLRQFPNLPFSLPADAGDWLLSKVLPDWARETHEAANDCVRTLHGITSGLADARRLGSATSSNGAVITTMTSAITLPILGNYRAASIASQFLSDHYLYQKDSGPYKHLDMNKLRHDNSAWADIAQATLNRDASYWNQDNVQCVAFVDMVFAIANGGQQVVPTVGEYACDFWGASAFKPPRWKQIANGNGLPQPGDIMVMTGGPAYNDNGHTVYPGHVAIVTSVSQNPPSITFIGSNSRGKNPTTFTITNGVVNNGWGEKFTIAGFIRQTGP